MLIFKILFKLYFGQFFLKCKLWWPTTHATWHKLLLSIFFFLSLNHTNTIYTSPTIPNFHLNFHSNQSLATSLFFLSLNPKMIQEKDYPEYQLTSLTPQARWCVTVHSLSSLGWRTWRCPKQILLRFGSTLSLTPPSLRPPTSAQILSSSSPRPPRVRGKE
jgi:hypothetical protein